MEAGNLSHGPFCDLYLPLGIARPKVETPFLLRSNCTSAGADKSGSASASPGWRPRQMPGGSDVIFKQNQPL